jgi:hypothetical protein
MTDLSKNIVVVLIIAALVVSIAGTWVVSEKLSVEKERADDIGKELEGNMGFALSQQEPSGDNSANVGFTKIK